MAKIELATNLESLLTARSWISVKDLSNPQGEDFFRAVEGNGRIAQAERWCWVAHMGFGRPPMG